ncbi:Detected protein of unknown function [Hibiscus syriacus]|uniref:Uncharacterized protein n=1 Tax=Hibiscus syriacus TaxID=106335 RepID=A0A6A3CTH9_HIBSY|nr:Detected protein of unknown function [Hibiscus syriacus]
MTTMTVKDEQVRAAMTMKDEWVRAAMTDDNMVVELLVRLKQAQTAPSAPKSAVVALKWGIRQPRSKPMSIDATPREMEISTPALGVAPQRLFHGAVEAALPLLLPPTALKRPVNRSLASKQPHFPDPRFVFTYLSFYPSLSAADHSAFLAVVGVGENGTAGNETTGTTSKRSRRKKTFAELKEEENLLLKEMVSLKKEIASVRATCKEQRAKNEKLKRIKLDLNLQIAKNEPEEVPYCQPRQRVFSTLDYGPSPSLARALDDHKSLLDSCNVGKVVLPDLNMIPVEDDSVAETLYSTT